MALLTAPLKEALKIADQRFDEPDFDAAIQNPLSAEFGLLLGFAYRAREKNMIPGEGFSRDFVQRFLEAQSKYADSIRELQGELSLNTVVDYLAVFIALQKELKTAGKTHAEG